MKSVWKGKNVFVTGCAGFLGSWLTEELVNRGANVIGLVRDNVPGSNLRLTGTINKITVVKGELEDYFLIERALNEYEIEVVFHLGAQTIVGISNNSPMSTFKSNIEGTWNILEASRRVKRLRAIVVASSDKAYGEQKKLPYSEESSLKGYFPYDVSKSCADLLAASYFRTYNLPACVVRCGNFYGGGDLNFNRIVPGTIRDIFYGNRPVIRSDGKYVRDYIYIKDAVSAYMLLVEKMLGSAIAGEAFNFSYGTPVSVNQIVRKILDIMDRSSLKPLVLNKATNEIKMQYLSSEKARKILGWRPAYSLEKGLEETVEWYKNFFNRP
jgi:CDP-glucose 4,6-dehydratase